MNTYEMCKKFLAKGILTASDCALYLKAGQITQAQYEELVAQISPQPSGARKWSSLAMKRVLESVGKWTEVKALLVEADKYDDFLMADYIAEDDAAFQAMYSQACAAYGKEAVDAILDKIPTE